MLACSSIILRHVFEKTMPPLVALDSAPMITPPSNTMPTTVVPVVKPFGSSRPFSFSCLLLRTRIEHISKSRHSEVAALQDTPCQQLFIKYCDSNIGKPKCHLLQPNGNSVNLRGAKMLISCINGQWIDSFFKRAGLPNFFQQSCATRTINQLIINKRNVFLCHSLNKVGL